MDVRWLLVGISVMLLGWGYWRVRIGRKARMR